VKLGEDKVQKQLVLCNLKEAYIKFKETHPDIAISFSKISELRSKWCVLASAYGTHTTRVCTIHQNMKLIMQVIDRCSWAEECVCVVSVLHVLLQTH
jgi:hypothetical protein